MGSQQRLGEDQVKGFQHTASRPTRQKEDGGRVHLSHLGDG